MASSGVMVSASGSASEAPEVPDNVGDLAHLGLFAARVGLARDLIDIDWMAPQPGV
nr:mitochondrial import receptor subunit TOM6 homolog [Peromyscus maniculatus bairdii]